MESMMLVMHKKQKDILLNIGVGRAHGQAGEEGD